MTGINGEDFLEEEKGLENKPIPETLIDKVKQARAKAQAAIESMDKDELIEKFLQ